MFSVEMPNKVDIEVNPNDNRFCRVFLNDNIKSVAKENNDGEVVDGWEYETHVINNVRYYPTLRNSIEKDWQEWVDYAINQKNVRYKSQEQRLIEQDLIIKELLELLIESGVTL